jgi:CHAD domain-containing protein
MAALTRPLRPAGLVLSPNDRAAPAARAVLRFHLRAFAREEAGARAAEVEPVHQLRVATRRLRATLRLFGPALPARFADETRRDLKWLAAAIGAVRDLDVLAEVVGVRARRLDPGLRRGLGPLAVAIHDRRAAAHAALVETLDSARCRRLLDRLAAFGESEAARAGGERLGDVAPDLVRPLMRAVRRAGRGLDAAARSTALHRLRIRGKRLRYALETLRGLGRRAVRKLISRLVRLQDFLGQHQDAVTQAAWLREFALRPDTPRETVLAVGALIHALERRARRRRRRFPALWRRVDRTRLHDAALAELTRGVRRRRLRVVPRPLGATGS